MNRSAMRRAFASVMESLDRSRPAHKRKGQAQIQIGELLQAGFTISDVGRLVENGYFALAENGRGNNPGKHKKRIVRRPILRTSSITVTPPGRALVSQISYPLTKATCLNPDLSLPAAPTWNAELSELHWGPGLVVRFKRAAPHLVRLLMALQQHDWSPWVPNPFHTIGKKSSERQLHEAISSFNRSPMGKYLRLHGDGSRSGFRWERLI